MLSVVVGHRPCVKILNLMQLAMKPQKVTMIKLTANEKLKLCSSFAKCIFAKAEEEALEMEASMEMMVALSEENVTSC
uniref:Uncharacterized protein n=1 Tax=Romanomermis culicivorax TaxID=13658 RepID=A0A915KUU9_ROMCU